MSEMGLQTVQTGLATARTKGRNYIVSIGNEHARVEVELVRGDDFMKLPKTKRPTLLKSGAEKILIGYGLTPYYTLLNANNTVISSKGANGDSETAWFNYEVLCELKSRDLHICDGVGCANTREKSGGFASSYDLANKQFKIARKRALVDAVLFVSGLSGMFKNDIEDEENRDAAIALVGVAEKPNEPITSAQLTRLYAIGGEAGRSREQVKNIIQSKGYASTKDIKQKDYDTICELIRKGGEK